MHVDWVVKSSYLAAILLEEDTTAHSRSKIPIDIHADSTYNIPAQSHFIKLRHETQLIFWNEAAMQHRYTFEAVNRTMKDIRKDPRSFGEMIFYFYETFVKSFQ